MRNRWELWPNKAGHGRSDARDRSAVRARFCKPTGAPYSLSAAELPGISWERPPGTAGNTLATAAMLQQTPERPMKRLFLVTALTLAATVTLTAEKSDDSRSKRGRRRTRLRPRHRSRRLTSISRSPSSRRFASTTRRDTGRCHRDSGRRSRPANEHGLAEENRSVPARSRVASRAAPLRLLARRDRRQRRDLPRRGRNGSSTSRRFSKNLSGLGLAPVVPKGNWPPGIAPSGL